MITDFIFDGQKLSDFGYMICDFNSSTGIETHMVSDKSFTDIKSPLSNKSHVVATSEDENLSKTIQIIKNTCNNNSLDITNDDVSIMTRWLCREEYKLFKWIDTKDDDEIFYEVQIKLHKITLADNKVGFELNILANAQHGFTREFITKYTRTLPLSTYECVKDKYEKGSKNDVLLSLFYPVHNKDIKKYEDIFKQLPEDLTEYDYWFFGRKNMGSDFGNCVAFGINVVSADNPYYFTIGGLASLDSTWEHNYEKYFDYLYEDYDYYMNQTGYTADFRVSLWGDNLSHYWKQYEYIDGQGWNITIDDEATGNPCILTKNFYRFNSEFACLGTNINFYSEWDMVNLNDFTFNNLNYDVIANTLPSSYINDNIPTISKTGSRDLIVNVFNDDEGYIYPDINIRIQKNGDLNIINKYENRTTCILDCRASEIITIIGGDTLQITSSDDTHDMSKCFNYKFPRLCSKYKNYNNVFSIDLDCDIEMKYKGIRKVGL